MSKTLLVTGSSGLIGSEVCSYFARELGYAIHGVDNNQRAWAYGVDTAVWTTFTTPASLGVPAATIATITSPSGIFTQNTGGGAAPNLGPTTYTVWTKDTSMATNYTALGCDPTTGGCINELYDIYGIISVASMPSKAGKSGASTGRR